MVLWVGAVTLVKLRLDHVVLQLLSRLGLVVVDPMRGHRGRLWLRVVVLVKLLDVQAAASLVHVHASAHGALDLNCLCPVSLLRVQLAAVPSSNRFDCHNFSLVVARGVAVRGRHDGLSRWVEAEVGLVHQLLVEGGVDCGVVVGDGVLVVLPGTGHFGAILE